MKKMINRTHIEGVLYSHTLELRTMGDKAKTPGAPYITGDIEVATDKDMTNIVKVHIYVTNTEKTKANYDVYEGIVNGTYKCYTDVQANPAEAAMVRIDSQFDINDFYVNRNGEEELVSAIRNNGGFIHIVNNQNELKEGATFETDFLLQSTRLVEANDDKDAGKIVPETYLEMKGYVFNFRGGVLPITYIVRNEHAIAYFEDLDASPKTPVFTRVKGNQVSATTITTKTEESAWGEPVVTEFKSSHKELLVNWAQKEQYELGEGVLTGAELKKAIADRELALADVKKRYDDYQASKKNEGGAFASSAKAAMPNLKAADNEFSF